MNPTLIAILRGSTMLRETPGGGGGGGSVDMGNAPWAGAGDGVWSVGEGVDAKPWTSYIGEGPAREYVEKGGWKTPDELALAAYTASQREAQGGPAVPKADAPPEAWSEFYKAIGRPETADAYEFKAAEGVKHDAAFAKAAKEAFHEAGLLPHQAAALQTWWDKYQATAATQNATANTKANEEALAALKTKMGDKFDEYRAAGERVMKAVELSPEAMNAIEGNIGAAALVELLANIGMKSAEGGFLKDESGGGDPETGLTKQQANAKITELRGDEAFMAMYNDQHHAQHAAAVERMMKLYAQA